MTGPDRIAGIDATATTIAGATVHYYDDGDGDGSPVVLLHGGIIDEAAVSWRYVLPALVDDHRVIAPDLPGYGESDPPTETPVPEYYRDVIVKLLDRIGVDRATIVGLSMGGAVGLSIAFGHPDRVAGLVAVDSYGLGADLLGRRVAGAAIRLRVPRLVFGLLRRSERLAAASTRLAVAPTNLSADLAQDVAAAWGRPDAGRAFARTQEAEVGRRGQRTNFVETLPDLAVPVRFIHGEHDRLIPLAQSVRAAVLAPDADCRVLRDCGHWPPRERPTRFLGTVSEFLPG